jgi:hypothetical protein
MIAYWQIRIHYAVLRRKTSEQRIGTPVLESFYADRHSSKFSSVNLNHRMPAEKFLFSTNGVGV